MRKKFVIDANVYLDALDAAQNTTRRRIELAKNAIDLAHSFGDVIISDEILDDITRALFKLARQTNSSLTCVKEQLHKISKWTKHIDVQSRMISPQDRDELKKCPDQDDIIYLIVAATNDAIIISRDKHLLDMSSKYKDVPVFHPADFVEQYQTERQDLQSDLESTEVIQSASRRESKSTTIDRQIAEISAKIARLEKEYVSIQSKRKMTVDERAARKLAALEAKYKERNDDIAQHRTELIGKLEKLETDPPMQKRLWIFPSNAIDYALKEQKEEQITLELKEVDRERELLSDQYKKDKEKILREEERRYNKEHTTEVYKEQTILKHIRDLSCKKQEVEQLSKSEHKRDELFSEIYQRLQDLAGDPSQASKQCKTSILAAQRLSKILDEAKKKKDVEVIKIITPFTKQITSLSEISQVQARKQKRNQLEL